MHMVKYRIAADLVVVLHASYVVFVVAGFALIVLGWLLRWCWVRNFWFRVTHLAAIVIVCLEAVAGIECPLTTLERHLRSKAGQASYVGDFIGHWVHELIFVDAPAWVFTVTYLLFGLAVIATFVVSPPRLPWRRSANGSASRDGPAG
jgi:hypothetical protein